ISHWISVGNGAVLDVPDYLEYAAGDSATNSVAVFLEGINDGSRFRAAAERCRAAGKQVFAFKAGTTDAGARAARSHTGKLAGSDAVYEGVLRQLGIVRAGGLEELVDLGQARSWLPAAPFGRRGVVLSVSGAGCTILADEIAHADLQLATLSEATRAELARRLPGFSQHGNPVDLTGAALIDLGILRDVIAVTIADPGVDFAIVSFATNIAPDFAHAVADAAGTDKPLVVVLPGDHSSALPMRAVFGERGIPHYREFKAAAVVLGRLAV